MTPLLMIPGMMCDARLFGPQTTAFSAQRTVIHAPIGAYDTVQALAAEVLRHAPQRFALAGLSMGGIVAMEVVRQAPDRVDRLALLDTNPLAETDAVKARRAPQIADVEAGHLMRVMRDQMIPNYLADGPCRREIETLCETMAMTLGPAVFVRQSRALRSRPDQQDTLRGFGGHALVLCGQHDALCPVERHRLMADLLPRSTLRIIEGAGHLPTLEHPQDTCRHIARWLEAE